MPLPASAYSSLAACRDVLKKSDALEYHSDGYNIISVKLFALRKALHSYIYLVTKELCPWSSVNLLMTTEMDII